MSDSTRIAWASTAPTRQMYCAKCRDRRTFAQRRHLPGIDRPAFGRSPRWENLCLTCKRAFLSLSQGGFA